MPAERHPFTIFWTAVLIDVFALGAAWSAWKASAPFALVVAAAATAVCAVATLVAGRILIVVSRAATLPPRTRSTP